VITGASAGIGAALAKTVGARGGHVVLAARRERELLDVALQAGPKALSVPADVTKRPDVQRILDAAIARFHHVDVWVNNAGRGITRPVLEISDADFDEMMLINVKSALYGMQVSVPHFQQQGHGHVINVSSLLGRLPYVSARSAYSAAKHALNALTVNLRMDLRERYPHIHVTTVLPGPVATDFGLSALGGGPDSRSFPHAQSAEEVADVIANAIEHPVSDVYTRPEYKEQVSKYYAAVDPSEVEALQPFLPSVSAR